MTIAPILGDRAIWTINRQLVDVATRISPFIGVHRISDDSRRMVGNPYLRITSGLPVIQPKFGQLARCLRVRAYLLTRACQFVTTVSGGDVPWGASAT
jgi:hypothetical protein